MRHVSIIYIFTATIIGLIVVGFTKAYHHYNYLKAIFPKEKIYSKNYFSLFTWSNYHPGLQLTLFLPYVKRYKKLEDAEAEKMYRKVWRLTIIEAIFWAAYLTIPFLV